MPESCSASYLYHGLAAAVSASSAAVPGRHAEAVSVLVTLSGRSRSRCDWSLQHGSLHPAPLPPWGALPPRGALPQGSQRPWSPAWRRHRWRRRWHRTRPAELGVWALLHLPALAPHTRIWRLCATLAPPCRGRPTSSRAARREGDGGFAVECEADLAALWARGAPRLLEELLVQPSADADCFVEVHSGEGGVDSMDWCAMLGHMYEAWAASQGLSSERVAELPGEVAGLRSLTLQLSGPGAAGLLAPEAGAHRLIRLSPFDRKKRRHTSFAVVLAYPDFDVRGGRGHGQQCGGGAGVGEAIPKSELKIEAMRSSGPGGQSVNMSDTAVRVTHLPTGVSVKCQSVDSQHDNLRIALKWLGAKLRAREEADRRRERAETYAGGALEASAAAERRTRTYTLHPQELVKAHRVNLASSDAGAVLAGHGLQPFLECGALHAALQRLGGSLDA